MPAPWRFSLREQVYLLQLTFADTASGMASAGALLHFIELPSREETIARRFAMTGQAAELIAMFALERQVSRVERVDKPLKQGFSGFLWKAARVLGAASLALAFLPTKSRRVKTAAEVCGTAAALTLRFSLLQAAGTVRGIRVHRYSSNAQTNCIPQFSPCNPWRENGRKRVCRGAL